VGHVSGPEHTMRGGVRIRPTLQSWLKGDGTGANLLKALTTDEDKTIDFQIVIGTKEST